VDLPDPNVEPTISVERLAALLGVARGTAYAAVKAGTVPSIRIGRRVVIPTARVLTMLGIEQP
jgi:excisionase family DNA binding protein